MARKPLAKGDLIKVTWRDCTEDATGNPDTAKCIERISYGLFWSQTLEVTGTLVTTTTIDPDGPHQSGWCAYPNGMVLKIEVIKRHK